MREELRESFVAMATSELNQLRRFAYAVCGDWHRADDLVQAALERMYVAWPRAHDVGDHGAYARKVLVRLAISETRRPWWRRERVADNMPETSGADIAADAAERHDLAQALAGLTAKQRAIVVLRFMEDRTVADVAQILGIAPGTVKRQSHDAIGHLRRHLLSNDAVAPATADERSGSASPADRTGAHGATGGGI
ncbi:SigE family RNA polymerase sigma factor [Phytoactinopolyspora mesophila]|uniref:SigE family RNA polymerase sigma factor n=1 Tax=Phytoactinopolyspora mesophila TaxID=2650750 RepID=A0A7K3M8L3_9ACTN|nr:SigE family RNA polymerase sigma factor [Phytoactinopolyspora mesophila]NDL58758.1 SigE family RNA polymerase sigma factor [Phytoactinopolyspora mesophila]